MVQGPSTALRQFRSIGLVVLMMLSTLPLLANPVMADGRDASIVLTVTPSSLVVNPGESGEYTVRVYNTGSNPVTVQLTAAEEQTQECNQYTSVITQISGAIDAGSYEETSMNVTLSQLAEGTCDTTITATATEQPEPPELPGQPASEEKTVTTEAGDGSGSVLYGVDLRAVGPSAKDWTGEDVVEWDMEVENTGRADANVVLTAEERDDPGCADAGDFSIEIDPSSVSVSSEDVESVTVSTEVPEGQDSDLFCWDIVATVQNDPTQNASDTQEISLDVPELRTCDATLSPTSLSVDPGKTKSTTVTFENTGNTEWSISVAKTGAKAAWVTVDGASSGLLPYDTSSDRRSFDLDVTPDDTVEAGSVTTIVVQGRDGTNVACDVELRVTVGQTRGASLSLPQPMMSNVEPGTSRSTTFSVTNLGNGMDSFRVSASAPPSGWVVSFDVSTVSVGSKHSSDRSADVQVEVTVPLSALATQEVELTISVLPGTGGEAYDEVVLRVTVAESHGMDITASATRQRGRLDSELRFPISIENLGNVDATFRCVVMSQSPDEWPVHYEDRDGITLVEIDVPARDELTVDLVVRVRGAEDLDTVQIVARIINTDHSGAVDDDGDGLPDNQKEVMVTATRSDKLYAMDVRFDAGLTGDTQRVELPPGGSTTIDLWIRNTGNASADMALFELSGLEGIATRELSAYGIPLGDTMLVPVGYGVWDKSVNGFVRAASGAPLTSPSMSGAEQIMVGLDDFAEKQAEYEARPYEVLVQLVITVNAGAETGDGGTLDLLVLSENNTANRSGFVSLVLDVRVIEDLSFDIDEMELEANITYPETATFEVTIVNEGNIESEARIFTSDELRGWSVRFTDLENLPCTTEEGELLCTMEPGERLTLKVVVGPPFDASVDDEFTFTVSVEPTDGGVFNRRNIELTVHGANPTGLLSLSSEAVTTIGVSVIGLLAVGVVVQALSSRKRTV